MIVCRDTSPHNLYRYQLNYIVNQGRDVEVRGKHTKELLDVATVIDEPRRRVHVVPGRRANPFLGMSEALHVLAGRSDVASLLPYNQRIVEFSDNGNWLYGAYGPRIKHQIPLLLDRLRADPNDRRSLLSIWEDRDLDANTKDPPCNDIAAFKLREGLLHMTVFNRSNDLHWGLYAVNIYQFSVLQEYLAARLGVELGTQTHISNSLHIYTEGPGAKITDRMLAAMDEPLPELPESRPLFPNGLPNHQEFVADCNSVLNKEEYGDYDNTDPDLAEEGVAFLEFAADFLQCYRQHKAGVTVDLAECRHGHYYADWLEAGDEFIGP